jgi:hypothetical protein
LAPQRSAAFHKPPQQKRRAWVGYCTSSARASSVDGAARKNQLSFDHYIGWWFSDPKEAGR